MDHLFATSFATFAEKVAPEHTALLVVDVQNNMCSSDSPSTKSRTNLDGVQETVGEIAKLIDDARAAGVRVIFPRNVPHEGTAAQIELASRTSGGQPGTHPVIGTTTSTWCAHCRAN